MARYKFYIVLYCIVNSATNTVCKLRIPHSAVAAGSPSTDRVGTERLAFLPTMK